jgi:hypothetical protein
VVGEGEQEEGNGGGHEGWRWDTNSEGGHGGRRRDTWGSPLHIMLGSIGPSSCLDACTLWRRVVGLDLRELKYHGESFEERVNSRGEEGEEEEGGGSEISGPRKVQGERPIGIYRDSPSWEMSGSHMEQTLLLFSHSGFPFCFTMSCFPSTLHVGMDGYRDDCSLFPHSSPSIFILVCPCFSHHVMGCACAAGDSLLDSGFSGSLSSLVRACTPLQLLLLPRGVFSQENFDSLAASLGTANSLTCLSLEGNRIGSLGATLLARGLSHNSTLTSLSLGFCGIGADGLDALSDVFAANTGLRHLNLDTNGLCEQGDSSPTHSPLGRPLALSTARRALGDFV